MKTPSMVFMWHKIHQFRQLLATRTSTNHPLQRVSTASWRKKSAQDALKRSSRATHYLAAVNGNVYRRLSTGRASFVSQLENVMDIHEFELLDVVGQGTFGTVRLARHLETGVTVAVKTLPRHLMMQCKQETNILREQNTHLGLVHPFIAKLYATFQDEKALYFVLEFCPGGELYSLVYPHNDGHFEEREDCEDDADEEENRKVGGRQEEGEQEIADCVMTESESEEEQNRQERGCSGARGCKSLTLENFLAKQELRSSYGGLHERDVAFYAACLVSSLEYLHGRGVLYRDLKLENIVLDADGYPKLIDFGLAKLNATRASERNPTMCGSPEYMAPEILQHQPYDQRVDLWSFGILVYELLFGTTPFYHANRREQGCRIISEPVQFPAGYEQDYSSVCLLIQNLLEKDPALRLASFEEVRNTIFFRSYYPSIQGWKQLEARQVQAPFVPRLDGPFDTSLFVQVQDDDEHGDDSDADSDFGY